MTDASNVPTPRKIGTACRILLEIKSIPEGAMALVASPTTKGEHVVFSVPHEDAEILDHLGLSILQLLSVAGPLLTGEHFRSRGNTLSLEV